MCPPNILLSNKLYFVGFVMGRNNRVKKAGGTGNGIARRTQQRKSAQSRKGSRVTNSKTKTKGRGGSQRNRRRGDKKKKKSSSKNKGVRQVISKAIKVIIRRLPRSLQEEQVQEWLNEYNSTASSAGTAGTTGTKKNNITSLTSTDTALTREIEGDHKEGDAPELPVEFNSTKPASLLYFERGVITPSKVCFICFIFSSVFDIYEYVTGVHCGISTNSYNLP